MASIQFEYDPERLIEEVQKRPGIWDFDDVQYRTKKLRHKLWMEVVNELMQNDVKVTKSEMRELELQLQKKWKSIRDCFQKYLKDPQRTKRPYIYSKQLQFILKNQNVSATEHTQTSDSDEPPEKKRVWKSRKKLKWVRANQQYPLSSDEDLDDNDFDNQNQSPEGTDNNMLEMAPKAESNSKTIENEFAFASVDNIQKNESEDPDKLFLLSLLPHLKSIPEEYRLNAKVDLMQVLRNANYASGQDMKMM